MIIAKRGSKGAMVRLIQRLLKLQQDGVFGTLTEEAVREFQTANGLQPDGVVGSQTLLKMLGFLLLPSRRVITEIIIHCTATPAGKDYTVDDIRRWHKQQGWSDIGYHYIVYRDGSIHNGRDVNIAGAHCVGHNTHSIGIAYIGGVGLDGKTPKDTRTQAQKFALLDLLTDLRLLYPYAIIRGHRDFANKSCPSFDAKREYSRL